MFHNLTMYYVLNDWLKSLITGTHPHTLGYIDAGAVST